MGSTVDGILRAAVRRCICLNVNGLRTQFQHPDRGLGPDSADKGGNQAWSHQHLAVRQRRHSVALSGSQQRAVSRRGRHGIQIQATVAKRRGTLLCPRQWQAAHTEGHQPTAESFAPRGR